MQAAEGAFGVEIDYALLDKAYEANQEDTRSSPAACTSCEAKTVMGNPDLKHTPTSRVERQNLCTRMAIRRFTRVTNGFGKKVENHATSVALY